MIRLETKLPPIALACGTAIAGTAAVWTTHAPYANRVLITAALVMVATTAVQLRSKHWAPIRIPLRAVLRDPVTMCWGLVILVLAVQALNSGRQLRVNSATGGWFYAPARIAYLPSAISREATVRMLSGFVLAATASITMRICRRASHPGRSPAPWVMGVVAPVALLGWASAGQWLVSQSSDAILPPAESYFLLGFGYANHAGAFFVLALAAALGLLCHAMHPLLTNHEPTGGNSAEQWFRSPRLRQHVIHELLPMVLVTFGCLFGALLSVSRFAIVISWTLLLAAGVWAIWQVWHRATPKGRIHAIQIGVISFIVLLIVAQKFAGSDWRAEFHTLRRTGNTGALNKVIEATLLGTRPVLRQACLSIWRTSPITGEGVEALRHLAPLSMNPGYLALLGEGTANAHCDPLEFLLELGLIGCIPLGYLIYSALMGSARNRSDQSGSIAQTGVTIGLFIIALYMLIDLPMRNPAVLALWFALGTMGSTRGDHASVGTVSRQ